MWFTWLSAGHGQTTGHTQYLAGDEGCLVTGEEKHRTCQIIGLANAPNRDGTTEGFSQFLGVRRCVDKTSEQSSVSRARADDIERDPVPRMFSGECLGERDEASLARGVDRFTRRTDPARIRGDVHDTTDSSLDHGGEHCVMHVESTNQIDVDEFRPILRCRVKERDEQIPSRIVDQHVDRTQLTDHLIDCSVDRRTFRDVTGNSERLSAA